MDMTWDTGLSVQQGLRRYVRQHPTVSDSVRQSDSPTLSDSPTASDSVRHYPRTPPVKLCPTASDTLRQCSDTGPTAPTSDSPTLVRQRPTFVRQRPTASDSPTARAQGGS